MYVDKQCLLADGLDIGIAAGSVYGSYAYNLGSTKDPGGGKPLYVVCCIDEAVTSSGSATVQIEIVDEEDETIDSSSVVICGTEDVAYTRFTLGKVIVIPVPFGLITQQYLGIKVTVAAATTTAGTLTAFIAVDPFTNPGA